MRKISRRTVLKGGLAAAGGALLGGDLLGRIGLLGGAAEAQGGAGSSYPLMDPQNILYGVCLQCNTQCTVKAKIQDGLVVKIDGNPYSPMNLQPQLSYATSPDQAARVDGSVCPKGQDGVETLYDPYRIRKVLKRAGPRGSNRWRVISFEQAVREITEGGELFADIGEKRRVPGFKDVFVLRDAALAKAMAADVDAIRHGKMTVEEFKSKYADHLDVLIDPDHPDLGPKNNQFVFMGGRISPDREAFAQRFTYGGLGSVNWYAHTTICEQAHHVAFQYATAQWQQGPDGRYAWQKGTNHMKPDYTQAEFIIFWGTGAFEANFGPTPLSPQISRSLVEGRLKIAVVDPRLSKTAAKGWWIPVRPADGDTALAVGMIRWIIENRRYDEAFLRNANQAAAKAGGEKSWTNATWLVDPETGRFLRASDLGLVPAERGGDAQFVALVAGKPVAFDANDAEKPVVGDLDAAYSFTLQTANGPVARQAKTAFRLLRESVFAHSLEFYAQESGVGMETLVALAREFTSHGKKAAIDFYRGPIKQTNGYLTAQAIILLNYLIGNVDHRGGLVPGGGSWNAMGEKTGQPFDLKKLHPGALTPFGVKLTRESSGSYETSTLFRRDGYPAKRPWFPFTSDVYQEIIPAAAAGYPYPIQILWLHYGTPALASPAGHRQIEMLRDVEKIPLLIATDIVIGESSMYADYLFPDLSYLERWGNPMGTSPATLTKTTKVRQPAAAPIPEIVQVDGEPMPVSMDALMLALAKSLGAPGYGRDGFAPGWDFDRPEQFYLKMVANVAWGDHEGDAVPEADAGEMGLLRTTRRHLPAAVFDESKWKAAVGAENWPRVVTVLNRGGRFEAASEAYDGAFVMHPWGKLLDLYVEPVGTGKDSITGKRFPGIPAYRPLAYLDGSPVRFPEEYSLQLITYKEIFGGQSRTASNYAAQLSLMPENFVYINAVDARRLGLHDGDEVLVTSPDFQGSFDVAPGEHARTSGKVRVIQGIRPGTVMVSWHYGHWAYGARDVVIDGRRIPGDSRRGSGLVPNPAMAVDAYLKDVSMTDPIAGDAAYSATRVKLVLLARGRISGPIEPGTPAFGEAGPVEVLAAGPRAARPGATG